MRKVILIFFILLNSSLFAQVICRDTNCEIFKGAIEIQNLPKKYSGTYITRHKKSESFDFVWSSGKRKEKELKAIDIIDPQKNKEEVNNFKNGQTTEIRILKEGATVLYYTFNDEGNVEGIYYSKYKPKKFVISIEFGFHPRVKFFKNGNISELNTFNTLDERISTTWYYPDQTMRLKADVKGHEFEGTITSFYPSGKVHKIGSIHNDLLDGYLLIFAENGSLLKEEFYKENIKDSISDLTKYSTQLFILKLTAADENKSIDRQNDLLAKNLELIQNEALKKQKEEELKVQEAEIAKQKLELELLSKNKAISDLTLREKQNEIAKAELYANQKRQEIENLSKENLIKELNIKNQESELKKSDAEALINSSKIETLNRENQLKQLETKKKQEELTKQKMIRNVFIGGFSLLILLVFLVFRSLQQNKKANKIITAQKEVVESQKHLVEEKNREILDSITYAKRIQSAILPQPKLVKEFLEDSFILYKPKDIVAGDFYWLEVVGDTVLFAAADCTGHGVPGAMVSVVCNNGLNRAVREFGLTNPSDILDKTRELVIQEFEKSDEDVKDGMDISLCALDVKTNQLKWSGANNPLWILRKNKEGLVEVLETKPDKQPIGKHFDAKPFTQTEIQLQNNDSIYIFTDGFQDQFGGPKEKKFRAAQLKEMFLSLGSKKMEEQRKIVEEAFENWKGDLEQVDDVCIIGVRV